MKINVKKKERQLKGAYIWRDRGGKGTLHYPTGMGKTFTACLIINLYRKSKGTKSPIVIVVYEEHLVAQWNGAINLFCEDKANIRVLTIDYIAYHNSKLDCDFLIIDEIHQFTTTRRQQVFLWNYSYVLGLTATWKTNPVLEAKCPVVDSISIQEAKKNGWVSKYKEYNLEVPLSGDQRSMYNQLTKKMNDHLKKFNPSGWGLVFKCLQGGKDLDGNFWSGVDYREEYARKLGWTSNMKRNHMNSPQSILIAAVNAQKAMHKRKQFLQLLPQKLDIILDINRKYIDKKIISFSQSTQFADNLANSINNEYPNRAVIYHSKVKSGYIWDKTTKDFIKYKNGKIRKFGKDAMKKEALRQFKDNESTFMSTGKALDTGLDVRDIEMGIVSSGTGSTIQHAQRRGRTIRIFDDIPEVIIVNLYAKDTSERRSLTARQKDSEYVYWIKSVNHIGINIPKSNPLTIKND